MDDMTLAGLRVVREVATLGSFTAAARSLGYSQPAISRQVAAMEAAAGVPLFVRNARGVSPSAAGAAVVAHAGRILADVDSLRRDLDGLGDRLAGRVRLGVFPAAAAVLAPRAIARLAGEHPGLEVRLTEASTPALLREVRAGRVTVAVIGSGTGLEDYDLTGLAVRQVSRATSASRFPWGTGSARRRRCRSARWRANRGWSARATPATRSSELGRR